MKRILLGLFLIPLIFFAGCPDDGDIFTGARVTFTDLTADGAADETTTELYLTFSESIEGLSAGDITVMGTGPLANVTKGILTGDGPDYTLKITGVIAGGTLQVHANKTGYKFVQNDKSVQVFSYDPGAVPIEFTSLAASSDNGTAVSLTLAFDQAVPGLNEADIYLDGGEAWATKDTLSGSGPEYTLGITVTRGGTLKVSVNKAGFRFDPASRNTQAYKAGEFLAFEPAEILAWPFWGVGTFLSPDDANQGSDVIDGIQTYWIEHAKTVNPNGSSAWFGLWASNLGWNLKAVGVEYKNTLSYQLMIDNAELAEDLTGRIDMQIHSAAGVLQIAADDLVSVKAFLRQNPGQYITVTYPIHQAISDNIQGLAFLFDVNPAGDIPGRVYIRNIRFYP